MKTLWRNCPVCHHKVRAHRFVDNWGAAAVVLMPHGNCSGRFKAVGK